MQGPAVAGARVALAAANRAAPGNDPETIGEHEFAGFFGTTTMTKDFERVWKQVEAHQGAVFSTPLGLPFEYEITGEHVTILIKRDGRARNPVVFQPVTKDQFRVAHRHMVDGQYESLIRGEKRAPYLWGILRGIQENPK